MAPWAGCQPSRRTSREASKNQTTDRECAGVTCERVDFDVIKGGELVFAGGEVPAGRAEPQAQAPKKADSSKNKDHGGSTRMSQRLEQTV